MSQAEPTNFRGKGLRLCIAGCATAFWLSGACGKAPATQAPVHHNATQLVFGGSRPVTLGVPPTYDNNTPTPLLIVLHGYSATGLEEEYLLGLQQLVTDDPGVLVAAPNGTVDDAGNQFWNATDACCNFDHSTVDDVGYITGLITDISIEWNVDPKRVYIMGHSNGGFMAYRMACDHPELLGAIVALAGDTYANPSMCQPSQAVSVLQIQGNNDIEIDYGGGAIDGVTYPGALTTIKTWAGYDHCSGTLVSAGDNVQLDSTLPGGDTWLEHESSCPAGIDVALWTIDGGSHIPAVVPDFHEDVWAWMKAHPKP